MWGVRSGATFSLRPENPKSSGPLLRGRADFPGSGDPTGLLPKVQEREAGEAAMAGGQSFLQQEICVLCKPSVSGFGSGGRRDGTAPGLEYGEVSGKAVHAGAVEPSGIAWIEGSKH